MGKAVLTARGQVVIPSKLRHKLGIKKGTQVFLYERDGEIVIKPITDEYIRRMAGITGTKGKLLKALMEEKAKERECGDSEIPLHHYAHPELVEGCVIWASTGSAQTASLSNYFWVTTLAVREPGRLLDSCNLLA